MVENKREMLSSAKSAISSACEQYVAGDIDVYGMRAVLSGIPEELWEDRASLLDMIGVIVYDEGIYDRSLEEKKSFAEFVCELFPRCFFSDGDRVLHLTELIVDSLIAWCSYASIGDFRDVLGFVPDGVREERAFTLGILEMVASRVGSLEWDGDVECLIPDSFLEDEERLLDVVRTVMGANTLNAADFALAPSAAWEHPEIIFWMLSNFQDEYESDHYLFTMCPTLRGSAREYLESFVQYIPSRFKVDKEFVLEFLGYDYFQNELDLIYEWMDSGLWQDKDLVTRVLEIDPTAVIYVPRELFFDGEISKYIEENIDFSWDLRGVPSERIPEWIVMN